MPSLQLLSFLVHGLRQTPVEFVVTYRSDEPPPGRHRLRPLQTELYRASAERLELRRFDQAELAVLLAGVLGWPPSRGCCGDFRPLGGRLLLRWLEMDAPIDYALASGWQANTTCRGEPCGFGSSAHSRSGMVRGG